MTSNNNISKHVKSHSKDSIIFDIYQLNPTFYKKIISRSSSFRFTHSNSFKSYTGKVPFVWEIQPGTPRADISTTDEIVKPIRFPPAIYSLTVPKPAIPQTGPKACMLKNIQKIKKIKTLQIQIPKIEIHKPNSVIHSVKVYFLKNLKKVEKIKNNMGKKAKPPTGAAEADDKMSKSDSDGFESSYSDFEDFTPSFKNSGSSTPSVFSPASPRSFACKSPIAFRFRNVQKGLLKWTFVKRNNGNF